MVNFVATSDGKIGFLKSNYLMHTCDFNPDTKRFEIWLWTQHYQTGRLIRYTNAESAKKASAEISLQLLK